MTTDRFRELALASDSELEELLSVSKSPAVESLPGFEWRGYNTALQTRAMGLQKFCKGFFQAEDRIEGYNIQVQQNGLDAPWLELPTPEAPRRYAFYRVAQVDPGSADHLYPKAILLDYGASPRNATNRIERLLRDYVVQPDPANPDLLLGKAYFALGSLRLSAKFFILGRLCPTAWAPPLGQRV